VRTQIEKGTSVGQVVAERFCQHDRLRAGRRKVAKIKPA
jgi:hypothetical protein